MIQRFLLFLGQARARALFILIAATGLISLMLNTVANEFEWVALIQTVLALTAIIGSAMIIGGRLEAPERARWAALLTPAIGALVLGFTVLPNLLLPLAGAAVGWVAAGLFVFRSRVPMEYQNAVKLLRKSEYAEATKIMDGMIKAEPQNPNHLRFRAEIFRVWGKLDRARRDYRKMTELAADSPIAFNGLAEVSLQMGDYAEAHQSAVRASELAPSDWVALYNLGMIEDRLNRPTDVINHLEQALSLKIKDARHLLLIHFYLSRAYARLGDTDAAAKQVELIRKMSSGFDEWQTILRSEQSATLKVVLGDDLRMIGEIMEGTANVDALSGGKTL
jgi:tetratricopeptide (TPR) repeat protein